MYLVGAWGGLVPPIGVAPGLGQFKTCGVVSSLGSGSIIGGVVWGERISLWVPVCALVLLRVLYVTQLESVGTSCIFWPWDG